MNNTTPKNKKTVKDMETLLEYHKQQIVKIEKEVKEAKDSEFKKNETLKKGVLDMAEFVAKKMKELGYGDSYRAFICYPDGSGYLLKNSSGADLGKDREFSFYIGRFGDRNTSYFLKA